MWEYFLWTLLIHVITACTSCCLRLHFSESLLVLPRRWRDYLVFPTFEFCWFSCTSYIKWMYYSCQLVVLLVVNYINFHARDGIILFFSTLGFSRFCCTSINTCTFRSHILYFPIIDFNIVFSTSHGPLVADYQFLFTCSADRKELHRPTTLVLHKSFVRFSC